MFCKNCGTESEEGSKFCKGCGINLATGKVVDNGQDNNINCKVSQSKTVLIKNESLVSKGKGFIDSLKTNKKNRGIAIVVIAGVVLLGGLLGYNVYSKNNVSKATIKKDFIGKTVSFGAMKIQVSEDNLKKISIKEKEVLKEKDTIKKMWLKAYNAKGTIELETDKYKVTAPISITYIYNDDSTIDEEGWRLYSNNINSSGEKVEVEIKEKASEDNFRSALIGEKFSGIEITEEIAKDLKFDKIDEKNLGTVAGAILLFENSGRFVSKKMNITAEANFTGDEWKIIKTSSSKVETIINDLSGDVSTDEAKKDINLLIGDKGLEIKYGYTTFEVLPSEIIEVKDMKVDSITTGSSKQYIITGSVKAKSGKATVDGLLDIKVSNTGDGTFNITNSKLTVDRPTNEEIIETLGGVSIEYYEDKKMKTHKITDNEKKKLKIDEVMEYKNLSIGHLVFGRLSYNNISDDIVTVAMKYNLKEKNWYVEAITSSTNPDYKEHNSKEAIENSESHLGI